MQRYLLGQLSLVTKQSSFGIMKLTTDADVDDPCKRHDGYRKAALPGLLRTSFKKPCCHATPTLAINFQRPAPL